MTKFKVEVGAKMGRDYAGVHIEFQMRRVVEIASTADIDAEYNKLVAHIERQHEQFINEKLPELRGVPDYKKPQAQSNWYEVSEFVLDVRDGNALIKAKTKESIYAKYGVPVYEEVAAEYKLDVLLSDKFSQAVSGVRVLVDESTKHKKVIKIEGLENVV